ncbi:Transcriptional activator protein [Yarrowia sp. C11]|nr:Transcriptional activator protein [Yarrowia sp. E02]KAG5365216.1 Transcriptional activator protein [Yarrowia sp. C11]
MPDGAQAWKIIKTPGSHTDRIAQACDRCRSKKIKCDGKRPHCSHCVSVGFECKTSDKLTRRAFPRGYTEALEDRIRQLEAENNKLLGILDLKDEQMELTNRVSSVMVRKSSTASASPNPTSTDKSTSAKVSTTKATNNSGTTSPVSPTSVSSDDDCEPYTVRQAKVISSDGSFRGASAGGAFLKVLSDRFRPKSPKVVPLIQQLFTNLSRSSDYDRYTDATAPTKRIAFFEAQSTLSFLNQLYIPPMVITDRLVSTYFSEWHAMFPVLDHCQFLADYRLFNELMAASSMDKTPATFRRHEQNYAAKMSVDIKYFATTLLLVCSLAAHFIAPQIADVVSIPELERNWRSLLEMPHVILPLASTTASTRLLAAYNLALTYSLHVNAIDDIWKYRSLVSASCHRMGLNRCQDGLRYENGTALTPYDQEIRQRLFWVSYIQDTFVASFMGTNQSFILEEVKCGLPSVDDEGLQHLRDSDFSDSEETKNTPHCFRAMISFSQVLSEVMSALYTLSKTSQSYKVIIELENKLQKWHRELPSDLKFEFANGMPVPTCGGVHQKSPLLYLMYNYAKILIHLPALCGESLNNTTQNAASIAVIQSAKSYVHVSNYLRVRNVLPTLCLNPSGVSAQLMLVILYGSVDYSKGGSLLQEVRQMVPQCIEGLNSDMKLQIPGSINLDSYDLLEEISSIILSFPARKKSSNEVKRRGSRVVDSYTEKNALPAVKQAPSAPMPIAVKEEAVFKDEALFNDIHVKIENSPPEPHDSLEHFLGTNSMVTPAHTASAPSSTNGEDDFKATTTFSQASSACGQLEQTRESWDVIDDSFKNLMMPSVSATNCNIRSLSVGNHSMALDYTHNNGQGHHHHNHNQQHQQQHHHSIPADLFAPLHPQQLTATGFTDIDKVRPAAGDNFDWGVNGILDWDWK